MFFCQNEVTTVAYTTVLRKMPACFRRLVCATLLIHSSIHRRQRLGSHSAYISHDNVLSYYIFSFELDIVTSFIHVFAIVAQEAIIRRIHCRAAPPCTQLILSHSRSYAHKLQALCITWIRDRLLVQTLALPHTFSLLQFVDLHQLHARGLYTLSHRVRHDILWDLWVYPTQDCTHFIAYVQVLDTKYVCWYCHRILFRHLSYFRVNTASPLQYIVLPA